MIYSQAQEIALRILKQLQPHSIVVDICGSVRREVKDCGDIEILCVPRITKIKDLFDTVIGEQRSLEFVKVVKSLGVILKGKPDSGRYVQIDLPDGIVLDLFIPIRDDYYRMVAIRTGSADYSHRVLAVAWRAQGWVGTEDGLRRVEECYSKQIGTNKEGVPKLKWICSKEKPTMPPVFTDEYSFFKFLRLDWIPPNKRYVK